MHKMQDSGEGGDGGDGGLFHKATTERFPGMVMPQDDTKPVVVIGLGHEPWKVTTATAGFAAVAAIAARVYAPFDADYAAKNLAAAERAFAWARAHPDALFRRNPEGIATGGYGDGDAGDELLFAAAELFRTTGKTEYDTYFKTHWRKWSIKSDSPHGWPNLANLALYAYAMNPKADAAVVADIRTQALAAADGIVERAAANGYRIPMLPKDYNWGSNSGLLNYAMMVQLAARFEPKPQYAAAVDDMLHYVFGRNTFSTSFVTHVGTRWAKRPHHRPSAADEIDEPWPGLIVGGPNSRDYNREKKVTVPPARGWTDETGSYTTNENAINWNAPLVFVLAGAQR
jgi:endoglucanase